MGRLSTHILDTASGRPARGVLVELFKLERGERRKIASATTNADGRTDPPLLVGQAFQTGSYELVFHMGAYFLSAGQKLADPPFLDEIPIRFSMAEPDGHYHIPLLASPWAFSTYRGS